MIMKNVKRNLLMLLLLVTACAGYGFYMYTKKPADIRKADALYQTSAPGLLAEFNKDELAANKKYIDQVIAVKGKVADVKTDATGQATVFLDSGDLMASVTCSFYAEESPAAKSLLPTLRLARPLSSSTRKLTRKRNPEPRRCSSPWRGWLCGARMPRRRRQRGRPAPH